MKSCPIPPAESVIRLPVTEDSWPMNALAHTIEPMDITALGYTEDEYIISGRAKLYTWPAQEPVASVELADAPYTTRFLVRKPADPGRFSGTVIIEMFNWARNYDRTIDAWGNCRDYITRSGDAWIGVTCRASVHDCLKAFDPGRYSTLSFRNPRPEETWHSRPQANPFHDIVSAPDTENGLIWDMYSQVALLVREQAERNPLYGYDVKKVIGTSAIPGDISTYVAAIDPISCRGDGGNIYDGFLIFMTGAPGGVNQYEPKVEPNDPRCKFCGKVPLIRVYTCGDMLGGGHHPDWAVLQRHPDQDGPDSYFRSYEIPGPNLFLKFVRGSEPARADLKRAGIQLRAGRVGGNWSQAELEAIEFPTRYPLAAAFENLKRWIDGTLPPPSQLMELEGEYPSMRFKLDEAGNVLGGVRTPYLDVPAYLFDYQSDAVPLPLEELRRRYASHEDYVQKVRDSATACVDARMLLPEDAEAIIQEAIQSKILCDKER